MDAGELEAVVRRAQRLDPPALTQLVEAYEARLRALFVRMTGDRDAAEELCQETLVRMVRELPHYEHVGRFEPWLFHIAANLARDHRRKVRRRGLTASLPDGLAVEPQHGASRGLDADTRAALQRALDELPELDREIVLLRHYSELPFQEVAELLGVPLGTALARAHRALRKLAIALSATEAFDEQAVRVSRRRR